MNPVVPASRRPRNWYVAFVAALVSMVFLSPFLLIPGLAMLLTVQSQRAMVEPIPGGRMTTGSVLSTTVTAVAIVRSRQRVRERDGRARPL